MAPGAIYTITLFTLYFVISVNAIVKEAVDDCHMVNQAQTRESEANQKLTGYYQSGRIFEKGKEQLEKFFETVRSNLRTEILSQDLAKSAVRTDVGYTG